MRNATSDSHRVPRRRAAHRASAMSATPAAMPLT